MSSLYLLECVCVCMHFVFEGVECVFLLGHSWVPHLLDSSQRSRLSWHNDPTSLSSVLCSSHSLSATCYWETRADRLQLWLLIFFRYSWREPSSVQTQTLLYISTLNSGVIGDIKERKKNREGRRGVAPWHLRGLMGEKMGLLILLSHSALCSIGYDGDKVPRKY